MGSLRALPVSARQLAGIPAGCAETMARFLHTSDWQMGMKAAGLGRQADRVREERMAAGRRVLELAQAHGVDTILIVGDTFEDNAVDRVLVRQVGELLGSFAGTVYITPGNHDPVVPGSVWEHPVWAEQERVQVLRERGKVVTAEGMVIVPCPLTEKYSSREPLSGEDVREEEAICVAMVHGTAASLAAGEPDFPVPLDAPARHGFDYVALGHWHSQVLFESDGAVRMAYSGSHETTKFGERDSGNVLLVEIAARGAAPSVTALRSGGLQWERWEETITVPGDVAALHERVQAHPAPESTLLRLRLAGLRLPADQSQLQALEELLAARFLVGQLDTDDLLPAPDDTSWVASLPEGVYRIAAERLQERLAKAADAEEQAVAGEALALLYQLQEKAES